MKKNILITGASSGIGEACARRYAANGDNLILFARNKAKLQEMKDELSAKHNIKVHTDAFDIRERERLKESINNIPNELKEVDVLINNAGLVIGLDREFEGCLEEWDVVIDTNIKSLLAVTRLVVPAMKAQGRGHIVNIGSVAGDAAYYGGSVYCATKSAVKALSDALRIELVDTPLRVTNIKPGLVETNFSVTRFRGDNEKADKVYEGIRPLVGEDVAETIFWTTSLPEHIQIAEMLVLPTNQASGTIVHREKK